MRGRIARPDPSTGGSRMSETAPAPITAADREVIRSLAGRWAEIAALPLMAERKRQWRALHDLRPERPMVLFETGHRIRVRGPGGAALPGSGPARRRGRSCGRTSATSRRSATTSSWSPTTALGWDLVSSAWGVTCVQVPAAVGEDEIAHRLHLRLPDQAPGGRRLLQAAHLQRGPARARCAQATPAGGRHRRPAADPGGQLRPLHGRVRGRRAGPATTSSA